MTTTPLLKPKDQITIGFAHAAYRLHERFVPRATGIDCYEVRTLDELHARIADTDVLVVSGLWRNELIGMAPRLRFIQSISAGTDQYGKDELRAAGIRLASGQGANERAVAEHAMGLMLALSRKIAEARDHQARRHWRPAISQISAREDELSGKTLVIVGMGRIGSRLARLAKAFDMHVVGVKRDVSTGPGAADEVMAQAELAACLARADYVALTCPLTPDTEKLIDAQALAAMKPGAYLINVARGRVVDEPALIAALQAGQIAGAGLDTFVEEPLPASSPLWDMANVVITPHTAGETQRYEDSILDYLMENLDRLWRGEAELYNQVV